MIKCKNTPICPNNCVNKLIPIRDELRSFATPYLTRIFIMVNIIVFFITFVPDLSKPYWLRSLLGFVDSPAIYQSSLKYGIIPNKVLQTSQLFTIFTSMFLHGNLIHLGGNMLFLYVFGDNVEDTFGHGRYFVFYILAGVVASIVHIMAVLYSVEVLHSAPSGVLSEPTIGASGAIAGVLGTYLVLYPKARVLTLVFFGWIWIVPIPAIFFLGFWFVYQLLYGMLAFELPLEIAYWAHIGGFLTGLFFGAIWRGRRRKREF